MMAFFLPLFFRKSHRSPGHGSILDPSPPLTSLDGVPGIGNTEAMPLLPPKHRSANETAAGSLARPVVGVVVCCGVNQRFGKTCRKRARSKNAP